MLTTRAVNKYFIIIVKVLIK